MSKKATTSKGANANKAISPSAPTKTSKKKVSTKSTATTRTTRSQTKKSAASAVIPITPLEKKLYHGDEVIDNASTTSTNTGSTESYLTIQSNNPENTSNNTDTSPVENIYEKISETTSETEENSSNIIQTTYLTDEELEHFRDILLTRRKEVVEDLAILYSSLKSEDSAGFNTSYSQHMAEHGTNTLNKEQMFLFIQRDERYLSYIDKALERIINKTYGVCVASGKPIPKSRLEAVPITAVRIEYKNK